MLSQQHTINIEPGNDVTWELSVLFDTQTVYALPFTTASSSAVPGPTSAGAEELKHPGQLCNAS